MSKIIGLWPFLFVALWLSLGYWLIQIGEMPFPVLPVIGR